MAESAEALADLARSVSGSGGEFDSLFRLVGAPIGRGQFGQVFRCRPRIRAIRRLSQSTTDIGEEAGDGVGLPDADSEADMPFGDSDEGFDDVVELEDCACKVLQVSKRPTELARLAQEINLLRDSVSCRFVVSFFGCFLRSTEGELMLVMELCQISLQELIEHEFRAGTPRADNTSSEGSTTASGAAEPSAANGDVQTGVSAVIQVALSSSGAEISPPPAAEVVRFPERNAAFALGGIVRGLEFLHASKIVHRDIKSANVLISRAGDVKLGDFGVARRVASVDAKMKTFAGSPYWMSPEAISRDAYTVSTDIWSVGIVCLEMLEGAAPLQDIPPMKAVTMIPHRPAPRLSTPELFTDGTRVFLNNCLQKDPGRRMSAAELVLLPFVRDSEAGRASFLLALRECTARLRSHRQSDTRGGGGKGGGSADQHKQRLEKALGESSGSGSGNANANATANATAGDWPIEGMLRSARGASSRFLEVLGVKKRVYFRVPLDDSWQACTASESEHMAVSMLKFLRASASDSEHILIRGPVDEARAAELTMLYDTGRGNSVDLGEWDPHDVVAALWMYLAALPDPVGDPGMFSRNPSGHENEQRAAKDVLRSYSVATTSVVAELVLLMKAIDSNQLINGVSLEMAVQAVARHVAPTREQFDMYSRWFRFLAANESLLGARLAELEKQQSGSLDPERSRARSRSLLDLLG
jgi:serine/threonine protein kinase